VNRLAWTDPERHLARPEVALPERGRRRQRWLVQLAGSHHAGQQVVCRRGSSGRRLGRHRAESVRRGGMAVQAPGGPRPGIVASLQLVACNAVQCSATTCNAGLAGWVQSCNESIRRSVHVPTRMVRGQSQESWCRTAGAVLVNVDGARWLDCPHALAGAPRR
jgi:hypothetical protein